LRPCRRRRKLGRRLAARREPDAGESDDVYESARAQFSEEELANLSLAIVAINGANRLSIAFRTAPGSYRAKARAAS
jgi:alkylhydroperoxidase family enzyme